MRAVFAPIDAPSAIRRCASSRRQGRAADPGRLGVVDGRRDGGAGDVVGEGLIRRDRDADQGTAPEAQAEMRGDDRRCRR
jgi:hypothetical protein